jgi:alpha-glucosidase
LTYEQFSFANATLTTSVTGCYDDTNVLANITIAGWFTDSGHAGCSAVKIMASGIDVHPGNVKVTSGNGVVNVTGLEGVAKAFHGNLAITFM